MPAPCGGGEGAARCQRAPRASPAAPARSRVLWGPSLPQGEAAARRIAEELGKVTKPPPARSGWAAPTPPHGTHAPPPPLPSAPSSATTTTTMSEKKAPLNPIWAGVKPFFNGGASGMLATCVMQPVDMVKVRIQLGEKGSPVSSEGAENELALGRGSRRAGAQRARPPPPARPSTRAVCHWRAHGA